MSLKVADRVLEVSISTGTGAFTLGGTTAGYRTFASACSIGDQVPYTILINSAWEVGNGTLTSGTTLERTTVIASSNSNALVDFPSGQKQVYLSANSNYLGGATVDAIAAAANAQTYWNNISDQVTSPFLTMATNLITTQTIVVAHHGFA